MHGLAIMDRWNRRSRFLVSQTAAPICFNPSAARSQIPQTIKKTEVILASRSKAQISQVIDAAFDRNELPLPESGAMR
jgi:hypothetical protein